MSPYHEATFASNDKRYTCFFGCCHVWRCAAVLAIFTAIWLLANIVQVIAIYSTPGISAIFLSIVLVVLILYAILTGVLIFALKSERPKLILPFLQFQGLAIIVCIGMVILCIISLSSLKRNNGDTWFDSIHSFSIVLLIEMIVDILFQAVVFYVVYKCYRFLREKINSSDDLMTIGRSNARFTNNVVTLSGSNSTTQIQFYNPALIDDTGNLVGADKALPWEDRNRDQPWQN
uniref:Lysosomal-associated transmembrane protein 4B n=1 Tax=Plectus sambesii TaxID=2011161 RepID=A0A914X2G7_9BILA